MTHEDMKSMTCIPRIPNTFYRLLISIYSGSKPVIWGSIWEQKTIFFDYGRIFLIFEILNFFDGPPCSPIGISFGLTSCFPFPFCLKFGLLLRRSINSPLNFPKGFPSEPPTPKIDDEVVTLVFASFIIPFMKPLIPCSIQLL